jgi:hypothetical protein
MSKSSYEQVRLDNIKRNELELERLGFKSEPKAVVASKPKVSTVRSKVEVDPDYGARRLSSRSSAQRAPGYFSEASQFKIKRNDDDDEEYDDKEDVRNYNDESIPAPTKRQRKDGPSNYQLNKELALLSNATEEEEPVLKLEAALTGKSSCRKCREVIDKGNMRVGMKAWIMGRSSW